jgi:hypothetical protein
LWRLFRGKKYNVLRRRVDTCVYDTNQLLLGTLLFTVVVFLFPTTLVYFVFFTVAASLVELLLLGVWLTMVLLNACPFYTLYLWCTRRELSLPSAIRFELIGSDIATKEAEEVQEQEEQEEEQEEQEEEEEEEVEEEEEEGRGGGTGHQQKRSHRHPLTRGNGSLYADVVYMRVRSVALPFEALFRWYAHASAILSRRYPAGALVRALLFGEPVHGKKKRRRRQQQEEEEEEEEQEEYGVYEAMKQAQLRALHTAGSSQDGEGTGDHKGTGDHNLLLRMPGFGLLGASLFGILCRRRSLRSKSCSTNGKEGKRKPE